jgi:hypothetical protein
MPHLMKALRILAFVYGITAGGFVLMVAVFSGGPSGVLCVMAFQAVAFAAWGAAAGGDLRGNLVVGFVHASSLTIGSGGLLVAMGDGISWDLVLLGIVFTAAMTLSFLACVGIALLQRCATRCEEQRRLRIRGISDC